MSRVAIEEIRARFVLDSRGNPTVECELWLSGGGHGRAIVPSGASTGTHEALELRDGGNAWLGKGVELAVAHINGIIREELVGGEWDQFSLDQHLIELDGTENKSNLGANATLGVSLAFAWAVADRRGVPLWRVIAGLSERFNPCLPVPLLNVINGGAHADNRLDIQEFMLVPAGLESFPLALRAAAETYHHLKRLLREGGLSTNVGDEGGFAPDLGSNREALELLLQAMERAGYGPGEEILLAIDAAASEFYSQGQYLLAGEGKSLHSEELISLYREWVESYPISIIEDGLAEDDWEGFHALTRRLGDRVLIVGDDLLVTNPRRIGKAIELSAVNAVLIKPNQIGTLSETVGAMELAMERGLRAVVSHRSGETEDVTIAHLAVGSGCGLIKTGAPARGERVAKYNELLRIAGEAGEELSFPGRSALSPGR